MGCGSTIGPIIAAGLGVRTVDVVAPQLSLHSVREMMATDDVYYAVTHFKYFFGQFTKIASMLQVGHLRVNGSWPYNRHLQKA